MFLQHFIKIMKKNILARKTIYFKKLDDMDFYAIMNCLRGRVQTYKKNDYIVRQGEKVSNAYIILSGETRSYYIDKEGLEFISLDYSKGQMYGIIDIISNNKEYQYDLRVISEEATVLLLDSYRLITPSENRCKRHIELMQTCFQEVGRQTKELEFKNFLLTLSKSEDKILAYLTRLSSKKKSKDFDIPYNRNELANFLGLDRSALSSTLSKMKKEGKIDYKLNHFTLLN